MKSKWKRKRDARKAKRVAKGRVWDSRDRARIRAKLWRRDGDKCFWCREAMTENPVSPDFATIEHIRPLSAGGSNRMSNLALAHKRCNR